jgi:hypothetical protein
MKLSIYRHKMPMKEVFQWKVRGTIINVEIVEKPLDVGSIVKIKDSYYMVMELPSCVSYECDKYGRHYLMDLKGVGFYDYPTNLTRLMLIIKNAEGIIYDKDTYYIEVKSQ